MKNRELTFKHIGGIWGGNGNMAHGRKGNTALCYSGVLEAFPGLPETAPDKVTFVLSTRKHPEAAEITYSMTQNDFDYWTDHGCLDDYDYVLCLDGQETYLMSNADDKMRKLWDQGYNYIRAEYSA